MTNLLAGAAAAVLFMVGVALGFALADVVRSLL